MRRRPDKTQAEWVTLMEAPNQPFAEMHAEQLEAAGVPCLLISGNAGSYLGASSPYSVKVPVHRLAEARALIE